MKVGLYLTSRGTKLKSGSVQEGAKFNSLPFLNSVQLNEEEHFLRYNNLSSK